ncbi:hypothetical Protein YC6258_01210 [Gynuella sunshinyii YC6258]|uniref:Uncharacterized protein n=1 Tax=Gynuella sunshinyii YC6258 TaxID=1445510 RepID=A0A0C5VIU5_9GAMM|nr:hypothetical Protein YC6258_01210 [Gynuella sunshinyii YC6258]
MQKYQTLEQKKITLTAPLPKIDHTQQLCWIAEANNTEMIFAVINAMLWLRHRLLTFSSLNKTKIVSM